MSKKNKTHEFEYILNLLSCYQREHKELTFSELLNEILENKNLKDCSNKELEDLIKSKIDEDKAKKLVFQPIKHYKLNENISIDFLKSLGFRDGGFFSEIENPKMNYYQRLDGDNEFHFEYNDIDNALCGKTHMDGGCFKPIRLTVIQMKEYESEKHQLEEWTGLQWGEILFDSNFHQWSKELSIFNKRIIGKSKLIFLIEDKDGESFGYYLNSEIVENYEWNGTDNKSFHFNIESHGRLENPMKCKIRDINCGY